MGTSWVAARRQWLGALALALVCGLAVLAPAGAAEAAGPGAIGGTWLTEDGDSRVDIAPTKAADGSTVYAGKVAWLKNPTAPDGKPLRDANNADDALRERPIMGLEIVSGFKPAAGGGWAGGTVYSPRTGKAFPAELSLAPDGRLQLKIKAGIVSKTLYWTR